MPGPNLITVVAQTPRGNTASEVAVLVRLRYEVRSTRRIVDELQVHWWSLQGGKVKALCHHEDTAQVLAAVQPTD